MYIMELYNVWNDFFIIGYHFKKVKLTFKILIQIFFFFLDITLQWHKIKQNFKILYIKEI